MAVAPPTLRARVGDDDPGTDRLSIPALGSCYLLAEADTAMHRSNEILRVDELGLELDDEE